MLWQAKRYDWQQRPNARQKEALLILACPTIGNGKANDWRL